MIESAVTITLDAIDIPEIYFGDIYKDNPRRRTAINPKGLTASTALHPHGLTYSELKKYLNLLPQEDGSWNVARLVRDEKPVVLEEDYLVLSEIYERMNYTHKKNGDLEYHIDYGEVVDMTEQEIEAYERICRRIIEYRLFQNDFDIKYVIAEWRWGINRTRRLTEAGIDPTLRNPKYFELAYSHVDSCLADLNISCLTDSLNYTDLADSLNQ